MNRARPLKWGKFIKDIRSLLEQSGFEEVHTPYLVEAGSFEDSIDCLTVTGKSSRGELHTSPEIEMKVLLSELKKSIFQVCKCFRDDPDTGIHLKEFTMLEFYRVGADYRKTMEETENFIRALSPNVPRFASVSVAQATLDATGIDITSADTETLARAATKIGMHLSPNDEWEDIFFKILVEKIEPSLDPNVPTFLYDYPERLAAMAVLNARQCGERYELFWQGMELCNGCTELGDGRALQGRLDYENEKRRRRGLPPHAEPTRLKLAIASGLPDCSGNAIGLDRLFWCLYGRGASEA